MSAADIITILEKWTRTEGWRKVGNGPWERIDLTPYGGIVPVVFLNPRIDWHITEYWEPKQ